MKAGPLDIGFAGYQGRHHIGPELQFGHVVGNRFEAPVLIIKTAWGGESLHKDFRPPSAEGDTGISYHKMLDEYHEALTRIAVEFPTLKDLKPSLEGFVWMQGWNDALGSEQARTQYGQCCHSVAVPVVISSKYALASHLLRRRGVL